MRLLRGYRNVPPADRQALELMLVKVAQLAADLPEVRELDLNPVLLSAKLGIVTGRNLAEMCREQFPRPVVWAMWVLSEIAAMATDLAEFLGGAIGLSLLFQMPQARMPVRHDSERRKVLRFSNQEVIIALAFAGLVNMAMVMMASSAFHAGHSDVAEIETAYHTLTPLLGIAAAGVFLVSLIASGLSSSTVGTMAGQMIMQGFVGFRIPIWVL